MRKPTTPGALNIVTRTARLARRIVAFDAVNTA
jgi:hypothetical protein